MVPLEGFHFQTALQLQNCVMFVCAIFLLQIILHSKNNLEIFVLGLKWFQQFIYSIYLLAELTNREVRITKTPVGVATNTTKGIVSYLVHKSAQ